MDPNLEAKERRLETPEGRRSSRTTVRAVSLRSQRGNRSRSRLRDSNNLRDRERDIERERDRLRMMERDLRAERDRLRDRDRSSARGDWDRSSARGDRDRSSARGDQDRSSARGDQDRSSARDRSTRPRTREVFIDFGSEVSLIKHSVATSLGLRYDANTSALKGFGNCIVQTLGGVIVDVIIDDVAATVSCQVVDDKNLDTPLLIGQSYTEQKHVVVYKDSNTLTFYNFSKELPFCREGHNFNTSVTILCFSGLMLYGLASIKLGSDFISNGPIMIGTKVNGVPNQQYIVYGGVHQMTNGTTYVTVQPLVIPCRLREEKHTIDYKLMREKWNGFMH
ncbi:hypothetical protein ACJJTC_000080 [Scirpophaga incertulas]